MNDTYVNPDDVPTDVIERAMRYAKGVPDGAERIDNDKPVGLPELGLALESRLENAQRLIQLLLWQPYDERDALHSFGALEHLAIEALELCWAIRELRPSAPGDDG